MLIFFPQQIAISGPRDFRHETHMDSLSQNASFGDLQAEETVDIELSTKSMAMLLFSY